MHNIRLPQFVVRYCNDSFQRIVPDYCVRCHAVHTSCMLLWQPCMPNQNKISEKFVFYLSLPTQLGDINNILIIRIYSYVPYAVSYITS